MGQILPGPLAELLTGQRPAGGGGNGGGGSRGDGGTGTDGSSGSGNGVLAIKSQKVGAPGGEARLWAQCNAHLAALSLRYGENSRTLLAGKVLPTLHGYVLCKNRHLCGV